MILLRSFVFNVGFYTGTLVLMIVFLPILILDRKVLPRCGHVWSSVLRWWLSVAVGVRVEIRGEIPSGPCLIAAKHQSAWEAIEFLRLLPDACFVLKRELTWIPVFGWYISGNRQIVVDRSGGVRALKRMLGEAQIALNAGRQIVVFPQGTRVEPGVAKAYQPGIALLYNHLDVRIIPVALNSGVVWGRNKFVKVPGTIVLEFLSAMPAGLNSRVFIKELSTRIERATGELVDEGRQSAGQF
tara:strand:- start:1800 stop:2525 length:726 start_codon:yes stop_codon:yes gene_type:complete